VSNRTDPGDTELAQVTLWGALLPKVLNFWLF